MDNNLMKEFVFELENTKTKLSSIPDEVWEKIKDDYELGETVFSLKNPSTQEEEYYRLNRLDNKYYSELIFKGFEEFLKYPAVYNKDYTRYMFYTNNEIVLKNMGVSYPDEFSLLEENFLKEVYSENQSSDLYSFLNSCYYPDSFDDDYEENEESTESLRVNEIIEKFKDFYGKNNITINGLSDDEDSHGGKIDRTEIIINNKEVVTLEAYEVDEVYEVEEIDVIFDDVEINKDNISLYYEFMDDEMAKKYRSILGTIFNDRNWDIINKIDELSAIDKRDTNFKVNWIDGTMLASKSIVFGVKDTLKPIDEYITEIKESKTYKEYVGLNYGAVEKNITPNEQKEMSKGLEKQFTFKTECSHDNQFVPLLLEKTGLSLDSEKEVSDALMPEYKMGIFSFQSSLSLTELKSKFQETMKDNENMCDMHRCWQTLAIGDSPNEEWYIDDSPLNDLIKKYDDSQTSNQSNGNDVAEVKKSKTQKNR